MASHYCVHKYVFQIIMYWKGLSHYLHWYGFSPVCSYTWFFRSLCIVKSLSHWLHWYGFLPECSFICFSGQYVLKRLHYMGYIDRVSHHCVHTYDFFRSLCVEKALSHWLHWYSFSPVCSYICLFRSLCIETWKGFITLVTLIWLFTSVFIHMPFQITMYWKSWKAKLVKLFILHHLSKFIIKWLTNIFDSEYVKIKVPWVT